MQIDKINEKIVSVENPFAKRVIYQDDNVVTFILNFRPGQALPPHTHYKSTVVVQVYAGTGEMTVDEKTISIGSGDIVTLKGNEKLSVNNTGNADLTLYVNMAPRPDDTRYSVDVG